MKLPIYMDYQATTPCDPRVVDAMLPYFTEKFGNAASRSHSFGWEAEEAVEHARATLARCINAKAKEIVFTSGATESDNIAVLGAAEMYQDKGRHIITCMTEHKAVLDPCKHLEQQGFTITWLKPDRYGQVSAAQVDEAITDQTILITLMHGNNEIGTLHPIAEIGAVAKRRGVLFHTDAAQTFGKRPIDVEAMGIDLLSISAHKFYAPKGIGALYVRRKGPRVRLAPIIFGGGHERGLRSGTLNVPSIVGMGKAAELAVEHMGEEIPRIRRLRDRLRDGILSQLDYVYLNGHPDAEWRLDGNLNLAFSFVEGEALMMGIKDIAVSSGSACTSASLEPSYVLRAIDVGEELAHTSIRFGIGRFTTEAEVDYAVKDVVAQVNRLREMSPLYEMALEGVDLKSINWSGAAEV